MENATDELKKEIVRIVNNATNNDMLIDINALELELTKTLGIENKGKIWIEWLSECLADLETEELIIGYETQTVDGITKVYGN